MVTIYNFVSNPDDDESEADDSFLEEPEQQEENSLLNQGVALILAATTSAVTNIITIAATANEESPPTRELHIPRIRVPFSRIDAEYGYHFRHTYRMTCEAFYHLLHFLEEDLTHNQRGAKNDNIEGAIRLGAAIRYFAGGSPYDIMISHHISLPQVYVSIWLVVDLINKHPAFKLQYPTSHDAQREIAKEFQGRSDAGFSNCGGCVDGLLVWIEKPKLTECTASSVNSGKYFCGRKSKFGLNLQAICDARRRFLDVSIRNPASCSDFIAFETSGIGQKLRKEGFLAPNIAIYGDNAYSNTQSMVVPFQGAVSGSKDAFNFFHSQVRMNIECAFGILVNRWRILKQPMHHSISIKKVCHLTLALCRLHNFCLNHNGNCEVPARYEHDELTLLDFETLDNEVPASLLDGGNHRDDHNHNLYRAMLIEIAGKKPLPRDAMVDHVAQRNIHRPTPNPNL